MIYFLHGEDTFRSRKKLDEIVAAFQEKAHGAFNVTSVDAEDEPDKVLELGRTRSLFSTKELIVIKRPSLGGERVFAYIRANFSRWAEDPTLTVIFWEDREIGKDSLGAAIEKAAVKSQEFKSLSKEAFRAWLERELASKKIRLPLSEKQALLDIAGADLWKLSQLLEMRSFGWSPERGAGQDPKVWDFTDSFLQFGRRSFRPLQGLLSKGFDAIQVLGALASSLRSLSLVWFGGKTAGLHPFVARKSKDLAQKLDAADLDQLFWDARESDIEIKTGRLSGPLALAKLTLKRRSPACVSKNVIAKSPARSGTTAHQSG